jgi:NAD(P)-dependent dehydrogenase (short-subunit alcohol dehydrogenase family)
MHSFLNQFRLDGKVALITGGSRGLGLEIAEALSEAGARVSLVARREEFFVKARLRLPDAITLLADVSDEAEVQRAVSDTESRVGPVGILVNAAGISWGADAMEMPAERIRQVMAVNLDGTFFACKAVAPGMKERGYGKIVNISSTAGLKGEPPEVLEASGYAASKGAVNALTRDLAVKWGRYGIRVNALAPGFFPTRMTEKVLPRVGEMLDRLPLGRAGIPGELGCAALFLASAASDYVTGQILAVDGGATA